MGSHTSESPPDDVQEVLAAALEAQLEGVFESEDAVDMHDAIERGATARVVELVEMCSVDPSIRNSEQETPLHWAALYGRPEIAAFLIRVGGEVNARDEDDSVPLHNAAAGGYDKIAMMLIEGGADIDVRDSDGETPLHLAANGDNAAACELLIDSGADRSLTNKAGKTPAQLASEEAVKALL